MTERRRVRLKAMAKELGISERRFRQFLPMGIPHTQLDGTIWFEPALVHDWLDQYQAKNREPGIKRTKGVTVAWPTNPTRQLPIAIGWGDP